ncbi:ankyrin-3-like [Artemia franciscana]|uniref:ankyrin-3-like n=1 Tax=Artemia franciscana TaxID=6661 RepID=UPI0032DB6FC4
MRALRYLDVNSRRALNELNKRRISKCHRYVIDISILDPPLLGSWTGVQCFGEFGVSGHARKLKIELIAYELLALSSLASSQVPYELLDLVLGIFYELFADHNENRVKSGTSSSQDDLIDVVHKLSCHVVGFCETFLTDLSPQVVFPGYQFIFKNRLTRRQGGLAVIVKEGISFRRIANLEGSHEEMLFEVMFGFRSGQNTEHAIVALIQYIHECLDRGEIPAKIYLDFKKAFDTTSHCILFSKLDNCGVHGPALDLVKSYLDKRKQRLDGVEKGNLKIRQLLTSNRAALDVIDSWKQLHRAVETGNLDICQLLISKGAAIDVINYWKETPLHIAVETGNLDICQLLISKGAAIDAINSEKETPLHIAVETGNLDICQLLISKGAAIDAINSEKETPLHIAVVSGNLDIFQLLISNSAAIDAINSEKQTPLCIAIETGNLDICQLLISKGAAIDAINPEKETPLHIAIAAGNLDICQLLISKGATIDAMVLGKKRLCI